MDPLNAPLLIGWAVLALLSMLTLGGCVPHMNQPTTFYQPPPPYYTSPPVRYTPSVSCVTVGNFTSCS